MLCIGIDIGKLSHAAGFVSPSLIKRHKRFSACPVITFDNSRRGFETLLEAMTTHASLDQCMVLLEKTGHYGFALEQFLQQNNIAIHKIHVQRRMTKRKTDKRDALFLANILYNQLVLGVQTNDSSEIRRLIPPSRTAMQLRTLVQRRTELTKGIVVRKNKLIAICDEVFPELTEIFKDPNGIGSLNIRKKFPTPHAIAAASMEELVACRVGTKPGSKALLRLQELAQVTIGTRNQARLSALSLEQTQLIVEMHLLQTHLEAVEAEIEKIVADSREGKILSSIPAISPLHAATLLSHIGSIANFERASLLRGYCGWAPKENQTGTTVDNASLDKGGNRLLKQTVYLIAWTAVGHDTEFKAIYDRLVPLKCSWDERKGEYLGRNKVVGRICGQIIGLVYALLRRDYELQAALPPGFPLPEPTLYDREVHREHRLHRKLSDVTKER